MDALLKVGNAMLKRAATIFKSCRYHAHVQPGGGWRRPNRVLVALFEPGEVIIATNFALQR